MKKFFITEQVAYNERLLGHQFATSKLEDPDTLQYSGEEYIGEIFAEPIAEGEKVEIAKTISMQLPAVGDCFHAEGGIFRRIELSPS